MIAVESKTVLKCFIEGKMNNLIEFNNLKLNMEEVLMILGYFGSSSTDYEAEIKSAYDEVMKISNVSYVYQVLPLNNMKLGQTNISIDSPDLVKLLRGCKSCIISAQTLGVSIDNYLRKTGIMDLAKEVVLDAVASSYIEAVSQKIYDELQSTYLNEGYFFTERFSPGYGQVPISLNLEFSNILNAERRIGLKVAGSGLMIPRKSVVAIWGVSDTPVIDSIDRCSDCKLRFDCKIRESGEFCARKK